MNKTTKTTKIERVDQNTRAGSTPASKLQQLVAPKTRRAKRQPRRVTNITPNQPKFVERVVEKIVKVEESKETNDLKYSTNRILHNYFDLQSSVGRSYAEGTEATVLSETFGTADITVSPGCYATMAFCPRSQKNNVLVVGAGTSRTSVSNPFTVGAGLTSTTYNTPYTSSPNFLAYRPVRFIVRLVPTTSLLNANGRSHFAYVPNLMTTNVLSDSFNTPWTVWSNTLFNTTNFNRVYSFADTPEIRWIPNAAEESITGDTGVPASGIVGYVYNGSPVAVTYTLTWFMGDEYVAQPTLMPYVVPKNSDVNPACSFQVGQFINVNRDLVCSLANSSHKDIPSGYFGMHMNPYHHAPQGMSMLEMEFDKEVDKATHKGIDAKALAKALVENMVHDKEMVRPGFRRLVAEE